MSKYELSIVIPCLNEAASLGICLQKATDFLSLNKINGEIIVVDNGSDDESKNIAGTYKTVLINEAEKGYGNAITAGVNHARGKYIIMGDADDSYDFSAIMPMPTLLREGYDMVIGNRFKGGIQKGAMPFLHRYIGNPVLSFIGKLFFRVKIGDFHCGLRGFTSECFSQLQIKTTGMEFASEMIVKAALLNIKIAETPVVLYPDKRIKPSHLRTWRDGWRHLRFLLLYSPRWLFLIPGLILIVFGIISSVSLITGPIHIAGKKLDIHTLMYTSCFVLLGFQFISFYFFTKLYAATHGLIPNQQKFIDNFNKFFRLGWGIIAGFVLFAAGMALNIKSFLYWKHTGFNNLNPVKILRWVIPSVTLILLGVQVVLSYFYLSILTIKNNQLLKNQ